MSARTLWRIVAVTVAGAVTVALSGSSATAGDATTVVTLVGDPERHPNISCADPSVVAYGVRGVEFGAGEVYMNMVAEAAGRCADLNGGDFAGELELWFEVLPYGEIEWRELRSCTPQRAFDVARHGVLVLAAGPTTCRLESTAQFAGPGNQYRAKARLTTDPATDEWYGESRPWTWPADWRVHTDEVPLETR